MRNTSFGLMAATILAAVAMMTGASFAQELLPCDTANVAYSPFDEHFADKMILQPGPAPKSTLIMGAMQFTTQRTRWMVVRRPDYMKAGPWATVVWIGNHSGGSLLQLAFFDHASGGVEIRWLNEKLLYGSVWCAESSRLILYSTLRGRHSSIGRWRTTVNWCSPASDE